MKYLPIFLFLLLASFGSLQAQESLRWGMNYQAVARDQVGDALVNQSITLQATFRLGAPDGKVGYTEVHRVNTGEAGLFNLVIGGGETRAGDFTQLPWATEQIWLEIGIDEAGGENFSSLGATQLLAVPYAFHALTAGSLTDEESAEKTSAFWKVNGNDFTVPGPHFLGTLDVKDLVFKTSNIERMRITAAGDVNISNSLSIGLDLNVGRDANIGRDLDVDNNANIDNDLTVWGIARFNNTTQSTTKDNGAVIVEGGVGIEKNVNIGGNTEVDGTLGVDGVTTLNNTTQSTTKDNGALVVEGGVGIEKNVNIGGNTEVDGTLGVDGITRVNNTTQSTTKDNGAVIVEGGVGIEKNVNIGGTTTSTGKMTVNNLTDLNGQVTITANLAGDQADYSSYPLRVQGGDHGVAIKLNNIAPDRNSNFLTMYDGSGAAMGRIEGFQGLTGVSRSVVSDIVNGVDTSSVATSTSTDQNQDPADVPGSATQFFNSNYGFGLLNSTLDFVYTIVQFAINAAAAAFICIGGDCDDVVWAGIDVIVNGVKLAGYIVYNEINIGVAFESGGADYAEWLQKANPAEGFFFGDVVGVKGGLISKEFVDAEKFMVISQSPTVIGAMPAEGTEARFEKIAFMGQVPVKVIGEVQRGDYILPSGNGDGLAIALSADEMRTGDYARIIGIAWGEADGRQMFSYVNTAVGINANDLTKTVERMQQVVNDMQLALAQVNPDYKPTFFELNGAPMAQTGGAGYSMSPTLNQIAANQIMSGNGQYTNVQEAMQPVLDFAAAQNFDLGQYPYLADLIKNPADQELAQRTIEHYTQVIQRLEGIMANLDRN